MDYIPHLRTDRIGETDKSGQMFLRWLEVRCLTTTIESGVTCPLRVLLDDYLEFTADPPAGQGQRYPHSDLRAWFLDYWDRVHPLREPLVWRKPDPNPYRRSGSSYLMLGLKLLNEPVAERRESSEIGVIRLWMSERCRLEEGGRIQAGDAYKSYVAYCERQVATPLAQRVFSLTLESLGHPRAKSNGIRYLCGLSLLPREDRHEEGRDWA